MRMAIIAITTNNSISVNPVRSRRMDPPFRLTGWQISWEEATDRPGEHRSARQERSYYRNAVTNLKAKFASRRKWAFGPRSRTLWRSADVPDKFNANGSRRSAPDSIEPSDPADAPRPVRRARL